MVVEPLVEPVVVPEVVPSVLVPAGASVLVLEQDARETPAAKRTAADKRVDQAEREVSFIEGRLS